VGAESYAAAATPDVLHLPGQTVGLGPQVTEWALVAAHGSGVPLALPVADGHVESRDGGLRAVRITFNRQIDPATVTASALGIAGQAAGDVSALVESAALDAGGYALTVTLSAAPPDGDRYTLTVSGGLRSTAGAAPEGDLALTVSLLSGDVDASGAVTAADVLAVRQAAGRPVDAATCRLDVNRSGDITGDDVQAVQKKVGASLP
jgi:hypothetical protein